MITVVLHLLRLLPFLVGGHRQLALENVALRHQLAVYQRSVPRPRLRRTDRLFWIALVRMWSGWKRPLLIVTPDTVLRWQRRRFREYWTRLSGRPNRGRPPVNDAIKTLIAPMAAANPLWGAPRIHRELLKLGIDVSERTVSRLLQNRRTPPSQTWRTFLGNHVRDLVSLDFFTVPSAGLRVFFVLVVLAHHRRRVVHFNVTQHPTAACKIPSRRDSSARSAASASIMSSFLASGIYDASWPPTLPTITAHELTSRSTRTPPTAVRSRRRVPG
jgi:putative transposase